MSGVPTYKECSDPALNYVNRVNMQDLNAGTAFCAKTQLGRDSGIIMYKDWVAGQDLSLSIVRWE